MAEFDFKEKYDVNDLVSIMKLLRSENGCPWDREQTHESIRKNFIEETYEVVEAIDKKDTALLREELGDVLLQVVFHSQMEAEKNSFDFSDVADEVCKKLIVRHPHIFSDVKADNSDQVLKNWDMIKKETKGQETFAQTLESVPKVLPALMRAQKVAQRAARAGFDYPDADSALRDLKSEAAELSQAFDNDDSANIIEELGDLMFSCANLARKLGADSEEVLTAATEKFINRFKIAEDIAAENKKTLDKLSADELDALWKQAKTRE